MYNPLAFAGGVDHQGRRERERQRRRINEQMGLLLPSDPWRDSDGRMSNLKMFDFELVTPQSGHVVDPNPLIQRYKLDIPSTEAL